jgi:hypothetical protein
MDRSWGFGRVVRCRKEVPQNSGAYHFRIDCAHILTPDMARHIGQIPCLFWRQLGWCILGCVFGLTKWSYLQINGLRWTSTLVRRLRLIIRHLPPLRAIWSLQETLTELYKRHCLQIREQRAISAHDGATILFKHQTFHIRRTIKKMRFSLIVILASAYARASLSGTLEIIDIDNQCVIWSYDNHGCTGSSTIFSQLDGDDCLSK